LKNSAPKVTYIYLLIFKMLKRFARSFRVKSKDKAAKTDTNIAAKDSSGQAAPHEAVKSGQQIVVRSLLKKGANVEARDSLGRTALHEAVKSGQQTVVRSLLQKGANADTKDYYGETALHDAAKSGDQAAEVAIVCIRIIRPV
jgi:ankyrin repeat protein